MPQRRVDPALALRSYARHPMSIVPRPVDVVTQVGESRSAFLNREMSWLDFNERVLELAEDRDTPLLERVKFAAIFAGNLDEFFQVRVATLRRQQLAAPGLQSVDGLDATAQLRLIAERAEELARRHARLFTRDLKPRLARAGIRLQRWHQASEGAREVLSAAFVERVFPVLTPLAVDPGHPFPYISNLSLNLAVWLRDPTDRGARFARVKVPPLLDRFVVAGDDSTFVPLELVIAANLEHLFPGMEILARYPFRVTRASDIELDDDAAEDLLRALEAELRRRRFEPAVRLEVDRRMPGHLVDLLSREPSSTIGTCIGSGVRWAWLTCGRSPRWIARSTAIRRSTPRRRRP